MFGNLSHAQRLALQNILLGAQGLLSFNQRITFLNEANLGFLINKLSFDVDPDIFVSELVRACERWGIDRQQQEYATVILARYLRDVHAVGQTPEARIVLDEVLAAYNGGARPGPLRVLFLAANPDSTGKLSLQEEYEAISQVRAAKSNVELQIAEHVRVDDLIGLVRDYKPHILHFAGHGDLVRAETSAAAGGGAARGSGNTWRGLFLLDNDGKPVAAPPDAAQPSGIVLETDPDPHTGATAARLLHEDVLGDLLGAQEFAAHIRLVFLNACYAAGQADAIVNRALVPFAVGMNEPINDSAAVAFARGFYQMLFDPEMSMETAFEQAKTALKAAGYAAHSQIPYLRARRNVRAFTYSIFEHLKA